jgi:hypothetical protein
MDTTCLNYYVLDCLLLFFRLVTVLLLAVCQIHSFPNKKERFNVAFSLAEPAALLQESFFFSFCGLLLSFLFWSLLEHHLEAVFCRLSEEARRGDRHFPSVSNRQLAFLLEGWMCQIQTYLELGEDNKVMQMMMTMMM